MEIAIWRRHAADCPENDNRYAPRCGCPTSINLHGGTGKSVANSVCGSLPGEDLLEASGATPESIATRPHL